MPAGTIRQMEKSYSALRRCVYAFWGAKGGSLPCLLGVAIVGNALRLVLVIGWRDLGNETNGSQRGLYSAAVRRKDCHAFPVYPGAQNLS
ncbi:hypothetical protein OH77DRAFT_1418642 [Trametes cingulata]|nr:hypothetical protein OH77DRAFT_1418642 [Trametes cingulata]